ncbi:MAG: hypothetical protein PUK49_01010 [Oscillospiraceae bacterium]|nr:hypothetical protein [Oscillospiraceae bacterium]
MKTKEYFKIAWTLMPEGSKTAMIIFLCLSYIMVISSFTVENGTVLGCSLMFLGYALSYLVMSAPLHGAAPSSKGSMKENAQARELRGGSSGIYDTLCVMPITRRQIAACYMSIYRIIIGIYSALTIVSLFFNRSSGKSGIIILLFCVISALNIYMAAKSSNHNRLSVIIIILLVAVGVSFALMGLFHTIGLSSDGIRNAAIIAIIASGLLNELIMRSTALNRRKFYARNGENNE